MNSVFFFFSLLRLPHNPHSTNHFACIFKCSPCIQMIADCLIVFTIAESNPDTSVSELKRDSSPSVIGAGQNPHRDSDRQSLPCRPDPAGCASYMQLYFPRDPVTLQHTATFNRGPGSQREEHQLPL